MDFERGLILIGWILIAKHRNKFKKCILIIILTTERSFFSEIQSTISKQPFEFVVNDLEDQGEIGRGAFGSVNKMVHKQSGRRMAVKRIRTTCDEAEQKKLLMDLDVVGV